MVTTVKEKKMKEESGTLSISLGMFICSFNQKQKKKKEKTVYQMECWEHGVKNTYLGPLIFSEAPLVETEGEPELGAGAGEEGISATKVHCAPQDRT